MGLMLSTLSVPLPKTGIVLGGTIELHGANISLACFHGINFKVNIQCDLSLQNKNKNKNSINCTFFIFFSRLNRGHYSVYVIHALISQQKRNGLITQTKSS